MYLLFWYFILYAFLGWCLEVVFCSINTGKFVNRGFLNGPLCPIYGFGAVFIVYLLTPIQDNFLLLFVGSVLVTSLLEFLTGWLLKTLFHTSWWDYSDQPFNIKGYICLKFSLGWGVAALFLMKILHPAIAGLVHLIPTFVGWIFLAVLYGLLLADFLVTVATILKLNRDLGEISQISSDLHKGSEKLAEGLGNTAISVAEKVDGLDLKAKKQLVDDRIKAEKEKLAASLEESKTKLEASLQEQQQKIGKFFDKDAANERKSRLLNTSNWRRERLLRAFPKMKNSLYPDALEELKQAKRHPDKKSDSSKS